MLNYAEAIHDDYVERRDGIAHSSAMDSCGEEMKGRVETATRATLELIETLREMIRTQDEAALDRFLNRWFKHQPGCHVGNQMCSNQRGLDVARHEPTGPYLFGRKRRKDDLYDGQR